MRPLGSSLVSLSLALLLGAAAPAFAAGSTVEVTKVAGKAESLKPGGTKVRVKAGHRLTSGTRLSTGVDGNVALRFPDGSLARVRPKSSLIVRVGDDAARASGATVFFGRIWSKVVKSVGGQKSFEVQSANAVAGVRGTEFEVGVADDGSSRVIVTEGRVDVGGDEQNKAVPISRGYEVEATHRGALSRPQRSKKRPNWRGWFAKRAQKLEKKGLAVARGLEGRLNKRRAKVQKLLEQQRSLRREIQKLEARGAGGAQLQEKLTELERVTARLVDMRNRLEASFGLFERWGSLAKGGGISSAEAISALAIDISKVAADFADMIEEGTDLSEEGMHDLIDDMKKNKKR